MFDPRSRNTAPIPSQWNVALDASGVVDERVPPRTWIRLALQTWIPPCNQRAPAQLGGVSVGLTYASQSWLKFRSSI
jgi:hypothetical protein